MLDPGLSFGTGHHPTTAFCLRQLAAGRRPGEARACLDVGTGSGILAIAAAKLGYAPVDAFDFDPQAVAVARANAQRNGVAARIRFWRQDLTRLPVPRPRKYFLICANLVSNLLLTERERILARLRQDGVLVVAGILNGEFAGGATSLCRRGPAVSGEPGGKRMVLGRFCVAVRDGRWRGGISVEYIEWIFPEMSYTRSA